MMKLLSAPARLKILCQLAEGEKRAGELCTLVGMKPPAMSQQLAMMRREGVLSARRDGQSVYYSIAHPAMLKFMGVLYESFCQQPVIPQTDEAPNGAADVAARQTGVIPHAKT